MQFPELAYENEAFIFEEREKREMEKFFVYLTFFHFCLCSPAPSTHGIFQARMLEWIAISPSRDPTSVFCVSCVGKRSLPLAPPGKPPVYPYLFVYFTLRSFNVL